MRIAISALLLCCACSRQPCAPAPLRAESPVAKAIVAELMADNPGPVTAARDGSRILIKHMLADDFELRVLDGKTGQLIDHHRSPDTQLAPTLRPDRRAIAFFSDHDGDQRYTLKVWELNRGHRELPVRPTSSITLRWSPAGDALAYFDAPRGEGSKELMVIDPNAPRDAKVLVDNVVRKASFAFSPDGRQLATAVRGRDGSLLIGDRGGAPNRNVDVVPGGAVRAIEWPEQNRLFVTGRARRAEFFALYEVALDTGTVTELATEAGDISGPVYAGNDRLLYHAGLDGETALFLRERGVSKRIGPLEGSVLTAATSTSGDHAYVLHTGRATPPRMLRIDLITGAQAELTKQPKVERGVEAERIDVSTADGLTLPAYVWEPSTKAIATMIRLHGGPDGQSLRTWEPGVQLLVRRGIRVVSLNYRNSTGYGATFERARGGHVKRIDDVLAAREVLIARHGEGPFFLLGHSYGALLAGDVLAAYADRFAGAILISYAGGGKLQPSFRGQKILAFHGENDSIVAPEVARGWLETLFGRVELIALEREGHNPHRLETWGRIYAGTLELIGRPSTN